MAEVEIKEENNMDMNLNVVIGAEERLLTALERLAKALDSKERPIGVTLDKTAEPLGSFKEHVTDPSDLSDSKAVEEKQHLHYGLQDDGITTYDKWDEMCKALDKAGEAKAKEVLAKYSENGEYGGVRPANWDKVIKACTVKKETEKSYTLETVRALARKVQIDKGKDVLHDIFQEFDKEKLSQFMTADYPALYERLQKEVQ